MIANSAVYIEEPPEILNVTERHCFDLADTLGAGTRALCDGHHQTAREIGSARNIGSRFQKQTANGRHRNGGRIPSAGRSQATRSLFNGSSITLGPPKLVRRKTLAAHSALPAAH